MKKIACLIMLLSLVGCATTDYSKMEQQTIRTFSQDVGKTHYDHFLVDLGPPTRITQGDQIFLAEWEDYSAWVALAFDKETKILRDWKYQNNMPGFERAQKKAAVGNMIQALSNGAKAMTQNTGEKYVYKNSQGQQIGTVERSNY